MSALYNIFISLLIFGMKVGSFFNFKLKKGLAGRRQSCEKVKEKFQKTDKVIWMHAASLGEYEQGLPVLEQLKSKFPEHKILITFFSPSGYENVVKKNHIADVVCYLPFDRKKWIKEFLSHFQPEIFFTVKYDFWYNLLSELKLKHTKTFVVSALFRESQIYFKPYGQWFVHQLKQNIDWFFHQTLHSTALAKEIGLMQSSTSGDTRFDRVKQLRNRDNFVEFIDDFKENNKTIVFGSSWEAEEKIAKLISEKAPDVKIIIAPHDLKRVENLQKIFPHVVLYSQLDPTTNNQQPTTILIIDCIGLLSKLYSYADLAVVGGGFHSKGLHNILEAATFGVPVVFGNYFKNNPEAVNLVKAEGGKTFLDEMLASNFILNILKNQDLLRQMSLNAKQFVDEQPNATDSIIEKILQKFN